MEHHKDNGKPQNGKQLALKVPVGKPIKAHVVKMEHFDQEKFERSLKIISGILTVIGVAATTIVKIMETAKKPVRAKKKAKKSAPKRYMRRRQADEQMQKLNRLIKATAKVLEREVKNARMSYK
jgi:F0F1-type ATP synthase epsilon subunit